LKIMAWTKAKTAAVAIASVLLAAGTTSVIVTEVRSSVDESLWEMKVENLKKAPPNTLIIRPTRYSDSTSMMVSDGRIIAHNVDLRNLLAYAYSFDDPDGFRHVFNVQRMILSADVPKDHHDLMFTYPYSRLDILQHAIGKKFGCTISKESIETNVLALKIKDPALLAKHVSKKGSKVEFKQTEDLVHWGNFPIASIIYHLERVFGQPVIEDPGLSGHYDISFQWQDSKTKQQSLTQELAAAGLELVQEVQPVEMLVVEKVK
jgi:uncharacterized protein (TIGR03435 family)